MRQAWKQEMRTSSFGKLASAAELFSIPDLPQSARVTQTGSITRCLLCSTTLFVTPFGQLNYRSGQLDDDSPQAERSQQSSGMLSMLFPGPADRLTNRSMSTTLAYTPSQFPKTHQTRSTISRPVGKLLVVLAIQPNWHKVSMKNGFSLETTITRCRVSFAPLWADLTKACSTTMKSEKAVNGSGPTEYPLQRFTVVSQYPS